MASAEQLQRENLALAARLEETEETIRALRAGEIDAVMVEAAERVFVLEAADRPYRLMIDQMHFGAATLTPDGTILHCNLRFCDLLGQSHAFLCGKPIRRFTAPESTARLEQLIAGALHTETEGECMLQRADGTPVRTDLRLSVVNESVLGPCVLMIDMSTQRQYHELARTQEALRASEERLSLAQSAGAIGSFEWNAASGAVTWSATMEGLYGLAPGTFGGTAADWRAAIDALDRERFDGATGKAFEQQGRLDIEFRIRRPDGAVRWMACRGRVLCNDCGALCMLGVNLDVTQRKHVEDQYREADNRKNEFLATLAHELRNPLAPIRSALQVLKLSGNGDPAVVPMYDMMERQVSHLVQLVDDLLEISRITRGSLELRKELVELSAVIRDACEASRPLIDEAAHTLEVALPEEPLRLDADPVRLAQLFTNLLNNAAKYTPPGGRIALRARRDAERVVVAVSDNGVGIPRARLDHVFDMFVQLGRESELAPGGLGIGLTVVRTLVELHGGTIGVHSDGPGCGSEFVVTLPLAPASSAAPPAGPEGIATLPGRRVLVVDDNRDAAESLGILLKLVGAEVEVVYDGAAALETIESFRPHAVLLDIAMPGTDGHEVARRVRAGAQREMLLVALTGWSEEDVQRHHGVSDFDLHLVKPVAAPVLIDTLARLLGQG